jgi:tetratricopeptide (TPR) repeat protein
VLAVEIAGQSFPPSDPSLSLATFELGLVHEAQGRKAQAIVLFKRALHAAAKAAWPDSGWIAMAAHHSALAYAEDGQLAEAELLLKLAIAWGKEPWPGSPFCFRCPLQPRDALCAAEALCRC